MKKIKLIAMFTAVVTVLCAVSASACTYDRIGNKSPIDRIKSNVPIRTEITDTIINVGNYEDIFKRLETVTSDINTEIESIFDMISKKVDDTMNRVLSSSIMAYKDDENVVRIEIYNDAFDDNRHISDHEITSYFETTTETTTEVTYDTTTDVETTTEALSSEEAAMVNEILDIHNKIRAEYGLGSLTLDSRLSAAATAHAKDMVEKGYFSHNSEDGTSFDQRIRRYVTDYSMLGENIAMGDMTAEEVMDVWMDSEGHRANILNENYTHIGIGYCDNCFVVDFAA